MNRILNIVCAGIVLALSTIASIQSIQASEKPNIVFIFADDWGWGDLSCHGHPYVKTPNIDRLAKEGTDFHRFTVASGVCSPSRTAVMTGHFPGPVQHQRPLCVGATEPETQHAGLAESQSSSAATFSAAGRLCDGSLRQVASRQRHDSGFTAAEFLRV